MSLRLSSQQQPVIYVKCDRLQPRIGSVTWARHHMSLILLYLFTGIVLMTSVRFLLLLLHLGSLKLIHGQRWELVPTKRRFAAARELCINKQTGADLVILSGYDTETRNFVEYLSTQGKHFFFHHDLNEKGSYHCHIFTF